MQPHRPLADILEDPHTEYKDILEAIKAHGRGSCVAGGRPMAETTNAWVMEALRESVNSEPPMAIGTVGESSDDEDDDRHQVECIEKFMKKLSSGSNCSSSAPRLAHHNVGSMNIQEVTFQGSAEQKTEETLCISSEADQNAQSEENGESQCAPLARPLLISNSAESKPFRGGSLKNVKEDTEVNKMDNIGNFSAGSPGGHSIVSAHRLPTRETPRCSSHKKNNSGECLPARRLPRRSSAKGRRASLDVGSFRRSRRISLTNVYEDSEADMGDLDNSSSELGGRSLLPSARGVTRVSSANTGSFQVGSMKNDTENTKTDNIDESINLEDGQSERQRRPRPAARGLRRASIDVGSFRSETSASSIGSIDSVNIMDFGIDNCRGSITESMLSLGASSNTIVAGSMSNLVDSCGFLAWANDSSPLLKNNCHDVPKRELPKRELPKKSDSSSTNSSSFSNMVDSMGFLGWESQMGDKSSLDLAAAASFHGAAGIKKEIEENESAADKEDSPGTPGDSWHIEDYEDQKYTLDCSGLSEGSGIALPNQLRRLSSKVTEGISSSAKRSSWNVTSDLPKETIKTNDIKSFLLKGHRSKERLSKSACSAEEPLRKSAIKTFFQNMRPGSDVSGTHHEDEYYSGPAFRINREDDVDIGELRRELCVSGSNDGSNTKSKLKKVLSRVNFS